MSQDQEILKESVPYQDTSKAIFKGESWNVLGRSALGHDITGKVLSGSKNAKKALLIGGVHGNETEGIRFMEEFVREFALESSTSPCNCEIFVLPVFNPDGFLGFYRGNGNKVDLNRNMPTKDWTSSCSEIKYFPGSRAASEPETSIMTKLVDEYKPDFIISFHSWKPMININGPAQEYAEAMKISMDMEIVEDIGYPTPGSLGTYAGWERKIPTITLEFERGVPLNSIYPYSRQAVLNALNLL